MVMNWSNGVVEYWVRIGLELFFSAIHYSGTPILQNRGFDMKYIIVIFYTNYHFAARVMPCVR